MSDCWLHEKPLYKCSKCKMVHCEDCQVYPCGSKAVKEKNDETTT